MSSDQDDVIERLPVGPDRVEVPTVLPVLPVRDVVMFPGVTIPLAIGRAKSLAALEHAGQGGFLIVATQRDPTTEEPSVDEAGDRGRCACAPGWKSSSPSQSRKLQRS